MNQPLGQTIGNALEVKEAIAMLRGEGPEDLRELCLTLGSHMVYLAKQASSIDEARQKLESVIANGEALEVLKTFIQAQNGDPSIVDQPEKLPEATYKVDVKINRAGTVSTIVADKIGTAAMLLGAGRATKESEIDLAVGIVLNKKIGEDVAPGDSIATLHTNNEDVKEVINMVMEAYSFTDGKVEKPRLIYDEIH
jgi:pyrimidine-nucleoside phosphorylase